MAIQATEKIWHNGKMIPWKDAQIHVMADPAVLRQVRRHLVDVVRADLIAVKRVIGIEHHLDILEGRMLAKAQRIRRRIDEIGVRGGWLNADGDAAIGGDF